MGAGLGRGRFVRTVLHSARLVAGGRIVDDGWVLFDGGLVAETGAGNGWRDAAAGAVVDATEVAGAGALLTPGFIDIHGHGGAGVSYDDGPDAIRTARALHRAHGTTRAVISLVTAPLDELERRVRMVADLTETDPDVLGSHLEGPFLDAGHRGAHRAELLRNPDPAALAASADRRTRNRSSGDAGARTAGRARCDRPRDPGRRRRGGGTYGCRRRPDPSPRSMPARRS